MALPDMALPDYDTDYLRRTLLALLDIPSPTGFTHRATAFVAQEVRALGLEPHFTPKGALLWTLPGASEGERAVAAHIDTLGALVKEVKKNGRLKLSAVGGYDWATVEGAEALVHGFGGQTWSGTVVTTKQSTHVHGAALREQKRDESAMELRLDAIATTKAETLALGVEVGNVVSFESAPRYTETGFFKGRHLDNKAAVALCLAVTRALCAAGRSPAATLHFFISNYEEVGHGAAAGLPAGIRELLCVDMAAVGEGQASDEYSATLCVKDASGPYDYQFNQRLLALARAHGVPIRTDIYPYYASDASAAWRAGGSWPAALVGPGVDASHAFERTHLRALDATARLLLAYALSPLEAAPS